MRIESLDLKKTAYFLLFGVIAANSFSIAFFQIFAGLFMGVCLLSFFTSREKGKWDGVFVGLAAAYLLANLISVTQSAYLSESLKGFFKVFRHVLLCFCVFYAVDSEGKFRKLFYFMAAVAFIITLDALIQGATGFEILRQRAMTPYFEESKRLTGPFKHANDFSAYLSLVFFVFLGAVHGFQSISSKGLRALVVLGLLTAFTCLMGTYSRGAWIAAAMATVLFAVLSRSRWLLGALALVLVVVIFFPPPLVKMRLQSLASFKTGSVYERAQLWSESLRMIQAKPVFGHGVNTYAKNQPLYKSPDVKMDNQYAHNGYLHIAAETGLAGAGAFIVFLFYFLTKSFSCFLRKLKDSSALAAFSLCCGIVSFLIHSATDTNLQSVLLVNLLWVSIGLTFAARRILCAKGA